MPKEYVHSEGSKAVVDGNRTVKMTSAALVILREASCGLAFQTRGGGMENSGRDGNAR